MSFKDSPPQFAIVDIALIDPDPSHVRQHLPEDALKGLTNAVQNLGLIHPIVVRPGEAGRYLVIVGERRRQAALRAGETRVPILIKDCSPEEAVDVRVFENLGLGVRAALEPRDMANAIQTVAERFASPDDAARYFGRVPTWLNQATAAANLSEKVTALLDSGKISCTSAAVQLEKLARKNELKAESLIEQIGQMPQGEKASAKLVAAALSEELPRAKKKAAMAPEPEAAPTAVEQAAAAPATVGDAARPGDDGVWQNPVAAATAVLPPRPKVNPGKVKRVAELLGLVDEDEEVVLARLIDEFLALKNAPT